MDDFWILQKEERIVEVSSVIIVAVLAFLGLKAAAVGAVAVALKITGLFSSKINKKSNKEIEMDRMSLVDDMD